MQKTPESSIIKDNILICCSYYDIIDGNDGADLILGDNVTLDRSAWPINQPTQPSYKDDIIYGGLGGRC